MCQINLHLYGSLLSVDSLDYISIKVQLFSRERICSTFYLFMFGSSFIRCDVMDSSCNRTSRRIIKAITTCNSPSESWIQNVVECFVGNSTLFRVPVAFVETFSQFVDGRLSHSKQWQFLRFRCSVVRYTEVPGNRVQLTLRERIILLARWINRKQSKTWQRDLPQDKNHLSERRAWEHLSSTHHFHLLLS